MSEGVFRLSTHKASNDLCSVLFCRTNKSRHNYALVVLL